jgi:RNA polymerase sigma factor (sigma-70 family)
MPLEPTVFVVDDDEALRRGLLLLIRSKGLNVETFASAEAFLQRCDDQCTGCLILDIEMPGISGLELQERLAAQGIYLPIIILTGHADVPGAVRALQGGAIDFIEKPFKAETLLDRIRRAIQRDQANRTRLSQQATISQRFDRLTPRERQVLDLVVNGKSNKVIGIDLGISERTVELHRSRIMKKLEARSMAALMRLALYSEGTG